MLNYFAAGRNEIHLMDIGKDHFIFSQRGTEILSCTLVSVLAVQQVCTKNT